MYLFIYYNHNRNNSIEISVRGLRPENMLYLVNEILESLTTDAFHGVHFYYMIPCPHCLQHVSWPSEIRMQHIC